MFVKKVFLTSFFSGGVGVELDLADEFNLAWEAEVIKVMQNSSLESYADTGVKIYINVARRYAKSKVDFVPL